MSEKVKSEMISRRGAFSLLGLAAVVSLAVPAAMLTATDADAQTQGMERRDERRGDRQERRTEPAARRKRRNQLAQKKKNKRQCI